VDTDWFEQYPNILRYFDRYVDRVSSIKSNAPLYFNQFLDQYMNQLSIITLKDYEVFDFKLLKKLCYTFPSQFANIDIPEPYLRLIIYPIPIRAYILGMDISYKIPSQKEIDQRLIELSKLGIDEYVKQTLSKNQPIQDPANIQDTLFENVHDYVLFDQLPIEENGKAYQFTRPEFQKLFTDRKNFWTKQIISFSDLYTIQVRNNICKTLNLPKSDTLINLLQKGCEGKLFQEDVSVKDSEETSIPDALSTNTYFYYLLQSMFGSNLVNQETLQPIQVQPVQINEQERNENRNDPEHEDPEHEDPEHEDAEDAEDAEGK
jgi:hypothetical protein